jgi:membrane protein DedA with SNARE-associated domain
MSGILSSKAFWLPGIRPDAPMHLDASVTNSLVTFATHVIRDLGLTGVALMIFSSAVIFVPGTEATMLFAGFNVYEHHLALVGIIIAGVIGDVLGALAGYWIGRSGLHELLSRRGSPIHVSEKKLAVAEAWFARFGAPAMALSRLVPVVRAAFPYAAGTAEMPVGRMVVFAGAGSVVWITIWALVGQAVGSNWTSWRSHLEYVDYAVLFVIVAAIVLFVVRRVRDSRARRAPA